MQHCELNCEVGVGNGRNRRNQGFSAHPRKRKKRRKKEKAGKFLRPFELASHGRGSLVQTQHRPPLNYLKCEEYSLAFFVCPSLSTTSENFCTFRLAYLRVIFKRAVAQRAALSSFLITFRRLSYFTQGRVIAVSIIDPVNARRIHHNRPG